MSVKIRLKRIGMKKQPHYRVVVTDTRNARDGRFIEEIGYYDPRLTPKEVKINMERANYWLGVGAKASPTVQNIIKIQAEQEAKGINPQEEVQNRKEEARIKAANAPKIVREAKNEAAEENAADDSQQDEKKAEAEKSEKSKPNQADEEN